MREPAKQILNRRTLIHGAASSSASGSASSRLQIAVTVGPFADVRRSWLHVSHLPTKSQPQERAPDHSDVASSRLQLEVRRVLCSPRTRAGRGW